MSDLDKKNEPKHEPKAVAAVKPEPKHEPKAVAGPIRVRATKPGFIDRYIEEGQEFDIAGVEGLASWMEPVDPAHKDACDAHRAKVAVEKAERQAKAAKAKAEKA